MDTLLGRRKPLCARIGIFGVGHYAYRAQFDDLMGELLRKLDVFID